MSSIRIQSILPSENKKIVYNIKDKSLNLDNENSWDEAFEVCQRCILKRLTLRSCNLTCLKIGSLLNIKFDNLVFLNLQDNQIGSRGAKMLAKFQFPKLESLNLSICHIGDEGVKHLTKAEWPNLTEVYFSHNKLKMSGYASFFLSNLAEIKQIYSEEVDAISILGLVPVQPANMKVYHYMQNYSMYSRVSEQVIQSRFRHRKPKKNPKNYQ